MKNFLLSFYEKIIDAQGFLFYIILSNYVGPFCSVEMNTATFHGLAFAFVRRCTVVKNTFAKERHFSDNLIQRHLICFLAEVER